ncbi:MAG: 3-deoxy-D-manno-octulosonic acid transferase [Parvibaculales bacterium]
MPLVYYAYIALTWLLLPFIWIFLKWRLAKGREEAGRLKERRGYASAPRPEGKLIWFHAASVGEVNSILPLIEDFLAHIKTTQMPVSILLTSGTTTSAQILARKNISGVLHQYVPVDQSLFVRRFLNHWRPDLAVFVESEIWPNLLRYLHKRATPTVLINARMSEKSFATWKRMPGSIQRLLGYFDSILAQDEFSETRLLNLGARNLQTPGNLKLDSPPPNFDAQTLAQLKTLIGQRPVWLAASTHQGEEEQIARTHKTLSVDIPDLLTIIVPRHPHRGGDIQQSLKPFGLTTKLRSQNQQPDEDCALYIADSLGELGLFYSLCPVSFIGGSLVPHGGQNPIEAALIGSAIITGPYHQNFAAVYRHFLEAEAVFKIADNIELTSILNRLMKNPQLVETMQSKALNSCAQHGGARQKTLAHLIKKINQQEGA